MKERELEAHQHKTYADLAIALNRFGILLGIFTILLIFLGLTFAFGGDQPSTDANTTLLTGTGLAAVGALSLVVCYLLLRSVDDFRAALHNKNKNILALMDGLEALAKSQRLLRFIFILFVLYAGFGVYRTFLS